MAAPPLIPVPRGRNWHEAYLLVVSLLVGLGGLLSGHQSRAVEAAFPAWGQTCWYGGLIVGASLGLAGIGLESVVIDQDETPPGQLAGRLARWRTGLILERAGLRFLIGLCAGYVLGAFATASVGDVAVALGVAYVAAFAFANFARARQISKKLPRIEAALDVLTGYPGSPR